MPIPGLTSTSWISLGCTTTVCAAAADANKRNVTIFGIAYLPGCPAVPHTPAEGRNVNFPRIFRIGNHAVAPLEIEAGDARPVLAAIGRAPRRGFKSRRVKQVGIAGIDGHVINMAVAIQHPSPAHSTIGR